MDVFLDLSPEGAVGVPLDLATRDDSSQDLEPGVEAVAPAQVLFRMDEGQDELLEFPVAPGVLREVFAELDERCGVLLGSRGPAFRGSGSTSTRWLLQ